MAKIKEPVPKKDLDWEQHENKWFTNFKDWQLCVCEPVKEDDKEFVGFARYYGKTVSASTEDAKKDIIELLKNIGKELNGIKRSD